MRSRTKQEFLRKHPICCFCGGKTDAKTVDHQPSEKLFPEGARPKGYWFPACESCNAYSSKAESKLPLILSAEAKTEEANEQFVGRVASFNEHRPHIVPGMMMTNREKRNELRERGMQLAEGVFLGDLPLMRLPHDEWSEAFDCMAYKLTLALHYKFSGSPLLPSGRVWFCVHSNSDIVSGRMPQALLAMREGLSIDAESVRATDGQLVVAGNYFDDIGVGSYALNIRQRIFVTGMSTLDASWVSEPQSTELRGPLPAKG